MSFADVEIVRESGSDVGEAADALGFGSDAGRCARRIPLDGIESDAEEEALGFMQHDDVVPGSQRGIAGEADAV
ncbi:hypothetical protein ACSYHF_01220 [Stenotrophomonas maltophilia group sp. P373]